MATVCQLLGIDYNKELPSPGGRPIPIVDNQSAKPELVRELFSEEPEIQQWRLTQTRC